MKTALARVLVFDLGGARLDDFLDQSSWKRLVQRKVDGSLRSGVALKVVFKLIDDRGRGKQTAVAGKCGEPDENAFVFESRNAVADSFRRFAWRGGADRSAHFAKSAARRFWSCRKVFSEIVRRLFGFPRGAALARFSFLHAAMLQKFSLQIQARRNRLENEAESMIQK